MSLQPPSQYAVSALGGRGNDPLGVLDHEIAAEKASALGRAGERVEKSLLLLEREPNDAADRPQLLKDAANAVYAYFIQRELCGLRRHNDAIREYKIPREVLARLGVS